MATPDILARIQQAGIRLEPLPDGRIKAAPSAALTDELRDLIRANRAEILAALDQQHRVRELAVQLRLYADRNGFTEIDFEESIKVAMAGNLEGWLAYVQGENETRH